MFNWNPMIVGTLINANHPVFTDFPTNEYADWQWWDILNHATAMDLTALNNITPIIQSIDSYEQIRNWVLLSRQRLERVSCSFFV